jgi:hypothetical protein
MKTTFESIRRASDTMELEDIVNKAASDRGIKLNDHLSWEDEAATMRNTDDMSDKESEMVRILDAAARRWSEVL